MSVRKLAIGLAAATGAVLVAMVAVGIATGATQERHEHFMAPDAYAQALLDHARGLRPLFALDTAFIALYTAFFATFALHLQAVARELRLLVWLGFGAMVATALLDVVENHHIVAMLESAEHGVAPSTDSIAWQTAESATKFSVSYVSLVLFGLAVPRTSMLGWLWAAFLIVGTLASAIVGYAVPPDLRESVESGRWIAFLVGFGLAIAWLARQPDVAR